MISLLVYAAFAFLLSLIREIVKDMEDIEGDLDIDSRTLPIVLGITRAKWVVYILVIAFAGMLGLVEYLQSDAYSWLQHSYILLTIQLPVIFLIGLLHKAREKKSFHRMSQLIKTIMLTGILSMLIL